MFHAQNVLIYFIVLQTFVKSFKFKPKYTFNIGPNYRIPHIMDQFEYIDIPEQIIYSYAEEETSRRPQINDTSK